MKFIYLLITILPLPVLAVDEFVADFDWLVATSGNEEFNEPLLTLNEQDLERFVATGEFVQKFQVGPLEVSRFEGIYLSDDEFNDPSLDQPASVAIHQGEKILAGAKGKYFRVDLAEPYILIEHWNGEIGCSVARWYLEFSFVDEVLTPHLEVVSSEYVDFLSKEKCTPS